MPIASASEIGTKFPLVGPLPVGGGSIGVEPTASFNDLSDPNDVGVLSSISGLDSPEVRDSGEDIVEFDGAVQGPNWYGARPIVLEGLVYGHATKEQRAAKLARLMKASNAMREDARLVWTPSVDGAIPVYLNVRRNQPLRIEGGWNKTFSCSLIARDPRIYSEESFVALNNNPAEPTEIINEGNAEAFPVYTLLGPMDGPIEISNELTGAQLVLNADLTFEQALFIDTLRRTVYTGARLPGSRQNLYLDPSFEYGAPTSFINATAGSHTLSSIDASTMTSLGYTLAPLSGAKVLRSLAGTTNQVLWSTTTPLASVSPGDEVTVSVSAASTYTASSSKIQISVSWLDSGNFVISSTSNQIDTATLSPTAWRRFSATFGPAPAGTAKVQARIGVFIAASGTSVLWDGLVVEKETDGAATGTFFDGDHPATGQLAGWTGSTNASTSWTYTTQTDPLAALTPSYAFIDFDSTVWAGLTPGENYISLDWTPVAGVGQSFRADWRHTWL